MTLDQHLMQSGQTAADFALAVGLTEASVSRIRKGQQNITRDVMRRIIVATNGRVTADGLMLGASMSSDVALVEAARGGHGGDDAAEMDASSAGNAAPLSPAGVA